MIVRKQLLYTFYVAIKSSRNVSRGPSGSVVLRQEWTELHLQFEEDMLIAIFRIMIRCSVSKPVNATRVENRSQISHFSSATLVKIRGGVGKMSG